MYALQQLGGGKIIALLVQIGAQKQHDKTTEIPKNAYV